MNVKLGKEEKTERTMTTTILLLILVIAGLLTVPFITVGYVVFLLNAIFLYVILALSWNLISGFCGYLSFGHHAFFGIGAYAGALAIVRLGLSPYLSAILAGVIAMLAAIAVGFPILRLRGAYFVIATLCLAGAAQTLMANWKGLTGGSEGLSLPPAYNLPQYYYSVLVTMLVAIFVMYKIKNSSIGLALHAIHEDEDAAEACGVDTTKWKVFAFAVSAFFPGVVGSLYAWYMTYIDPPSVFNINILLNQMTMALFGGVGTVTGPIVGAIIFSLISEFLWANYPTVYQLIVGLIIVLVVVFMPEGLVGIFKRIRTPGEKVVRKKKIFKF